MSPPPTALASVVVATPTGSQGEETSPLPTPTGTGVVATPTPIPTRTGVVATPIPARTGVVATPTPIPTRTGVVATPTGSQGEETPPPSTSTATTAVATPTPAPTRTGVVATPPSLTLAPFVQAESPITYLTHSGDGSGRVFLVEKAGRIRIIQDGQLQPQPFLDIRDLVQAGSSERGLLSVAFDPHYGENGEFYVNYTANASSGGTVVARYKVSADPNVADPASGQAILEIAQPAPNHNGGQLQFGPDGYLYVGMGDGGSAGDPWGNGQNLNALLGKLLRLDARGQVAYAIPAGNPFTGSGDARPEIWAYGLRNPWRFSFDRQTGDLYIADVGQNAWEEVNFQRADSAGGENYGWNTMEALACYRANTCDTDGKVLPVAEYSHDQGCSVTGGYVYRGQEIPGLVGTYLYADYCTGTVWGLRPDGADGWQSTVLVASGANISSFGEDAEGELYVLDLNGQVYRLVEER